MHVGSRGQETYPLKRGLVTQVFGIFVVCLFVKLVGVLVILASFGVSAFVIECFGAVGRPQRLSGDEGKRQCEEEKPCDGWFAHSFAKAALPVDPLLAGQVGENG